MVEIIRKTPIPFFKKKEVWFAETPRLNSLFRTVYLCTPRKINLFGYVRTLNPTMTIDLSKFDETSLLASFRASHRSRIRKAATAGVQFEIEKSQDVFMKYYNDFALLKNIPLLQKHKLLEMQNNFLIFRAVHNDEIIGMSSVLFDDTIGRATGSYLAYNTDANIDREKQKLISYTNLFLYYQCMVFFLKKGYKIFDLGGYYKDAKSAKLQGINEFKHGFHGDIINEYDYWPFWVYWHGKLKSFFHSKSILRIE